MQEAKDVVSWFLDGVSIATKTIATLLPPPPDMWPTRLDHVGKKEDFTEVNSNNLKHLGVGVLTTQTPSLILSHVLAHWMTSLKVTCSRPLEVTVSPD